MSSSILQPHCVHLCVLSATPCLSAFGFINNENVVFSVSLFSSHFPFFLLPPFFPPLQPFMSPRYPGGPRPALRMPNQVLNRFLAFLHFICLIFDNSQYLCCRESVSILISFHVRFFLSLLGESRDLSLSCQTVWTQQDRKVQWGQFS